MNKYLICIMILIVSTPLVHSVKKFEFTQPTQDELQITMNPLGRDEGAMILLREIILNETYEQDWYEEHVRIKFFTDQEIRNISNNKYFDDAGKPLVFWLDESFKDDSSLKNKNSIKDKIKLSVSKILIKNGVISEKLNKFKKSDNYSFDQIPLSEKKDVFGTKNIYFEDKSSNIKEEENNVHKDTRELKEDEEKEDYIKIEKEQDIPLHKSFDYEHIDNKNKNKEYYKKLDNVNYGYLEPQHKKISDNEEDEEDMTDNVSGKSRLRIDTDNIFDKFKKNDDPYNIARKRKKLVSGNKNNRDHDSDRSSKDRSEKEESKNTKHHSKKRKNKNKDKSEHKENIRDGIIPVIFGMFGWIFGQDILVKFIIALIAGIIAFGLIFRSMGLMLGY